jgi:hypothetical protein
MPAHQLSVCHPVAQLGQRKPQLFRYEKLDVEVRVFFKLGLKCFWCLAPPNHRSESPASKIAGLCP